MKFKRVFVAHEYVVPEDYVDDAKDMLSNDMYEGWGVPIGIEDFPDGVLSEVPDHILEIMHDDGVLDENYEEV